MQIIAAELLFRRFLVFGLTASISGCWLFKKSDSETSESGSGVSVAAVEKDSGGVSGSFKGNGTASQTLKISGGVLKDAAVILPANGLAIDVTASIDPENDLLDQSTASTLGISTDAATEGVGTATSITVDPPTDPLTPFTLQLPLAEAPAALTEDDDKNQRLVIVYRIKIAATGQVLVGLLPRSTLTITGRIVQFSARYFGVYQLYRTPTIIAEAIEKPSSPAPIPSSVPDTTPPGAFTIDGMPAYTNATSFAVSWTAATDATTYDVTLASDATCSTSVQSIQGVSTLTATLSSVAEGAYFVCVAAKDGAGNSVSATNNGLPVTVDLTPPGSFALAAPSSPSSNQNPTVTWTSATGAVSYSIKLTSDSGCSSAISGHTYSNLTGTSLAVSPALPSGTFYICGEAVDGVGNLRASSNVPSYSVDVIPPGTFSITAPLSPNSDETPDVIWDAAPGASDYDLVIATDSGCANPVSGGILSGINGTTQTSPTLSPGAYFICVTAFDAADNQSTASNNGYKFYVGWMPTATLGAPSARANHTAVWTGSEMIIWGGNDGSSVFNTGYRYNPASDSWTAMSTSGAPAARTKHTAVFHNGKMIVWGGCTTYDCAAYTNINSGGVYDIGTDTWSATSVLGAPQARYKHTAVVAGTEMIVWGGVNYETGVTYLYSGGRCTLPCESGSWSATMTSGAPTNGVAFHSAVWADSKMIVWGGSIGLNSNVGQNGKRYVVDTWSTIASSGAYINYADMSSVWTGSKFVVWGGWQNSTWNHSQNGALYDPTGDTWTAMATLNAPSARAFAPGLWTGSRVMVWGGGCHPSASCGTPLQTGGGLYDPVGNAWTSTFAGNEPTSRRYHSGAWSGSVAIYWGGHDGTSYLASGGVYRP